MLPRTASKRAPRSRSAGGGGGAHSARAEARSRVGRDGGSGAGGRYDGATRSRASRVTAIIRAVWAVPIRRRRPRTPGPQLAPLVGGGAPRRARVLVPRTAERPTACWWACRYIPLCWRQKWPRPGPSPLPTSKPTTSALCTSALLPEARLMAATRGVTRARARARCGQFGPRGHAWHSPKLSAPARRLPAAAHACAPAHPPLQLWHPGLGKRGAHVRWLWRALRADKLQ